MTHYRVYVMSEQNRIIEAPAIIECSNHEAAAAQAREMLDGHAIEVWEQARLVIRLEPERKRQSYSREL